jgi:iron complex outermembrane receptor protein
MGLASALSRWAVRATAVGLITGLLGGVARGAAFAPESSRNDLADLSLEELSNIKITSVSRREERLSKAAASIFVITADDIRRSGATSLPEAMRLAPNLEVARITAGQYAISARGFNNAIGNKLLVLIDGRTVYTPLYSGVNWDSQFVMLEDIERIEVISGPGATLWGANAVNGVINVITRTAQATQGTLVAGGGGNRETAGSARYGGRLGENGYFRVYGMGSDRNNTTLANGSPVADGLRNGQGGFRADWTGADYGATLEGNAYQGRTDPGPAGSPTVSGANLLARWTQQLANGSNLEVQTYYDHTEGNDPFVFADKIDTFDIQFQHSFALTPQQRILWGGGYRYARDDTQTQINPLNPLVVAFIPARRSLEWGNVFVQDEVALKPDLNLTLGMKLESNVYTGIEFLPSVRLAWSPGDNELVWGALSRAVRAPARLDRDFRYYLRLPNSPLIPIIDGGPDFQSEIAYVAETGYRAQPASALSYSITGFYAFYDKLRSVQPPPGALIQNMIQGSTYGVEAWGTLQVTPIWRMSAGMVALHENLRVKAGSLDPTGPSPEGNDPKFQWMLHSSLNLPGNSEFDVYLRHVNALPEPVVPAYTALDARLGWRPHPDLELSVTVQNLFDRHHVEFGAPAAASEIDRRVFFKVVWRM